MKWFIVKVTCATLAIETSTHWGRSAGCPAGFGDLGRWALHVST